MRNSYNSGHLFYDFRDSSKLADNLKILERIDNNLSKVEDLISRSKGEIDNLLNLTFDLYCKGSEDIFPKLLRDIFFDLSLLINRSRKDVDSFSTHISEFIRKFIEFSERILKLGHTLDYINYLIRDDVNDRILLYIFEYLEERKELDRFKMSNNLVFIILTYIRITVKKEEALKFNGDIEGFWSNHISQKLKELKIPLGVEKVSCIKNNNSIFAAVELYVDSGRAGSLKRRYNDVVNPLHFSDPHRICFHNSRKEVVNKILTSLRDKSKEVVGSSILEIIKRSFYRTLNKKRPIEKEYSILMAISDEGDVGNLEFLRELLREIYLDVLLSQSFKYNEISKLDREYIIDFIDFIPTIMGKRCNGRSNLGHEMEILGVMLTLCNVIEIIPINSISKQIKEAIKSVSNWEWGTFENYILEVEKIQTTRDDLNRMYLFNPNLEVIGSQSETGLEFFRDGIHLVLIYFGLPGLEFLNKVGIELTEGDLNRVLRAFKSMNTPDLNTMITVGDIKPIHKSLVKVDYFIERDSFQYRKFPRLSKEITDEILKSSSIVKISLLILFSRLRLDTQHRTLLNIIESESEED